MTDQELLKLAAKAHGNLDYVENMGWIHVEEFGERGSWWDPLIDDRDAFRLAVKLGLIVDARNAPDVPVVVRFFDVVIDEEVQDDDAFRATRRAIVRAAAEIGKDMP